MCLINGVGGVCCQDLDNMYSLFILIFYVCEESIYESIDMTVAKVKHNVSVSKVHNV